VATMPACGSKKSDKLSFVWGEPSGYLTSAQVSALATSQPRSIQIKAGVMTAGLTYVFKVTTFIEGNANTNSSDELSVYAVASDLFAALKSGSIRKQSRLDALSFDATKSYDPDKIGVASHLSYNWDCYDKSTHAACTDTTGATLSLASTSKITIAAQTLSAGDYIMRLWVSCASDGRNATAAAEVTLAATAIPSVSIAPLAVTKVNNNAGSYLQLSGSILGDTTKYGTLTYLWTRTAGDAPAASTGYSTVFASSVNGLNTVIQLGALTAGTTYRFRLTAYAQGDDDTVAAVSGYSESMLL
jgi:hypothetical protein